MHIYTYTYEYITGRWTREEHQLFIKGLELHGKGWKRIAEMIKTRTVVQIRTHAQKYFLKLSKTRQGNNIRDTSLNDDEHTYGHTSDRKVTNLYLLLSHLLPIHANLIFR